MAAFAFYMFAVSAIAGGLFTVISRNPVHSVLWLILAFLSSAGLFVLLGAEFVAMLLVIVYVGAVAVREVEGGRLLELETAADDRGRVIGRQGRVAKAMRAVLGASRHGTNVRLDIVD